MSNKKYYISKFNCSSSVLAHTFVLLLFAFNSEHFFLFPYLIPSVAQILFFPSFVPYFYFFISILYPFPALKSLFILLSFCIYFPVFFFSSSILYVIFLLLSFHLFQMPLNSFQSLSLDWSAFLKKLCLCKHHTFSAVYLFHISNF